MTDETAAFGGLELPTFEFTIAFGDMSALNTGGTGRAGCAAGACPHPVAHPAEADWEQLVSAVPVEGQLYRFKPRCEGMAYPTEDDFRAAVSAVRPESSDDFSLQRLRTGWSDEVVARIGEWPDRLRSKLAALSEGWAGDDFDAFAAQADQTRSLVEGVLDDIEATVTELQGREEAIYTLQGDDSGEIPYPAPLVGVEGEWSDLVALHVRPAWWHGDCITMTCEEAERALELGGADPGLATEVREFIEERVGERLAGLGGILAEVRLLVSEEAKVQFGERVAAELAAYAERQAAIDEAIAQKRTDQSAELQSVQTTGEDKPYSASAELSYMDLQPPQMEQPAAPVTPQTTQDPSPTPPGGDGSVQEADADDESPWDAEEEDDGESGGLASGGFAGGGGGSGSFGAGGGRVPGAVAPGGGFGGAPQGLFGPATTPATTTGGSSTGAGGSRAAMAGGPQGSAGAKHPPKSGGKPEERDGEEAKQDLTNRETGNVWGYVKPTEDPYA